jgi:hypothetical protein
MSVETVAQVKRVPLGVRLQIYVRQAAFTRLKVCAALAGVRPGEFLSDLIEKHCPPLPILQHEADSSAIETSPSTE